MKIIFVSLFLLACFIPTGKAQNFSLHFDGEDDYVIVPDCAAMTSPSFTIEGWFKCRPSELTQVIVMAFLDIPDKNANITVEVRTNGLLRFNFRSVATVLGGVDLYSTTYVTDYEWHHFAAIKEAEGRLWLYIDGFPEAILCGTFDAIEEVPLFELGRNRYEAGANFRLLNGFIDDFKIWDRAKNCREVYQDFKNESSGLESGLYSNYKFDTVSDTVFDCSINKNHGLRKGAFGANNLPVFSTDIPTLADKMCESGLVGVEDDLVKPGDEDWVTISPNPVLDILSVELNTNQKSIIQIFASDGRLVREVTQAEKLNHIDVSALPGGAYLVKISHSGGAKMQNFVKI